MVEMEENMGALSGSRASTEPCGLGPLGFDPERCAFLVRCLSTKKPLSIGYTCRADLLDELLESWTPYGFTAEFTVVPKEFVESGPEWFERTIEKAAPLPWVRKEAVLAIAAAARERGDAKQAPSEGPQSGHRPTLIRITTHDQ